MKENYYKVDLKKWMDYERSRHEPVFYFAIPFLFLFVLFVFGLIILIIPS